MSAHSREAASTGRRNSTAEHLAWFHPSQGLSRARVELSCDSGEIRLSVDAQVGVLWKVLTEQAIGVLVAAALPGAVRVAEDVNFGIDRKPHVLGHLFALVP